MSILDRLLRSDPPDLLDSDWSQARRAARMGVASAGPVDTNTALAHSAVWACSTLISDIIATWPWHAYRDGADGRERVDDALIDNPSDVVSPIVWRTQVLMSLLLTGNAFGMVTAAGVVPDKIELIDPHKVSWAKKANGTEEWRVNGEVVDLWPVGPLWHLPGYVLAGQRLGLSVLSYAASTINLGRSATALGTSWFDDGAHPPGILRHADKLTSEQADEAKNRWMDKVFGSREPVVMGGDWSYEPVTITEKDSQFLETIGANKADVASFFRVQPELIGAATSGSSITYANVEQRFLSVLQLTFGPWTLRLEEALTRLRRGDIYVKASTDAFLRTDSLTSSLIIDRDLRNGMLNLDEGRALKDRPPVEGVGQHHIWPPLPAPQESEEPTEEDNDATA